jgi:hypothetical protein
VAVSPSVVNQAAGFSDIVGRATDYQQEGGHVLSVPSDSGGCFGVRLYFRSFSTRLGQSYDALRGLLKQRRGF